MMGVFGVVCVCACEDERCNNDKHVCSGKDIWEKNVFCFFLAKHKKREKNREGETFNNSENIKMYAKKEKKTCIDHTGINYTRWAKEDAFNPGNLKQEREMAFCQRTRQPKRRCSS